MSRQKVWFRFLFWCGLLALLLVGGAAFAGRSDNAETGFAPPVDKQVSGSDEEVAGVQSDQPSDNFLSDAEGQAQTGAPNFFGEEIELMEESESNMAEYFTRAAGSNFVPRDSVATYSYGGGGCLRRDSNVGESWFTYDVQVPDGALIDFLRVYYYDNSASNDINSELWAFDGAGGTTLIAEADSTGSPGYSSEGSGFFAHTVDNVNQSLVVVASIQGGVGASLELCGIRIRYQYNAFTANFLPAILNQTGP